MRSPTISMYFIRACLLNLQEQPALKRELLAKNNIAPHLVNSPNARVPAENYANLLHDTMFAMSDEILGYGSQAHKLGSWQTMVELVVSSENLGESLRKLARFYRLIPWGLETRLTVDAGGVASMSLPQVHAEVDFDPYLFESFLFYIHRTANWLVGRQIPLLSVDFCFDQTPHCDEYWNMFVCKNIRYGQPHSRLRFSASMLELRVNKSPLATEEFLKHVNRAMITQMYTQKSWHYKISRQLESCLTENLSFNDISRMFNLHPHTLRKYLGEEGFQYREIKDRVRCDNAIYLLSTVGKSVEETASLTGFSEASAFIKAFKKWTGTTPVHYKLKILDQG